MEKKPLTEPKCIVGNVGNMLEVEKKDGICFLLMSSFMNVNFVMNSCFMYVDCVHTGDSYVR